MTEIPKTTASIPVGTPRLPAGMCLDGQSPVRFSNSSSAEAAQNGGPVQPCAFGGLAGPDPASLPYNDGAGSARAHNQPPIYTQSVADATPVKAKSDMRAEGGKGLGHATHGRIQQAGK